MTSADLIFKCRHYICCAMRCGDRLVVGVGLALVITAGSMGYLGYEYTATNGIGFHDADDLVLDDRMAIKARKKAFFDFMRPVIEAENDLVLALRSRILVMKKNGKNANWLTNVASDYGVDWTGKEWTQLLKRVDAVPLTLVLGQSANESSWGQSRFSQMGNNMFGQWCFQAGCGLVPDRRDEDKNHEVAAYRSVNDSVRAYLMNINSTRAYNRLRKIRWQARQQGRTATGIELAVGLESYSERGDAYVREIQAMIRTNRQLMVGD